MQGLEGLPTWVQAIVGLAIFLGTAVVGIRKYIKPSRSEENNAVVLSATLADGQAVRDLISAINRLIDVGRLQVDAMRNMQDEQRRTTESTDHMSDKLERVATAMMTRRPTED